MTDAIRHTCRPCGCGFIDGERVVTCPTHEAGMAQSIVDALEKGRKALADRPRTLEPPPEAFDYPSLNGGESHGR